MALKELNSKKESGINLESTIYATFKILLVLFLLTLLVQAFIDDIYYWYLFGGGGVPGEDSERLLKFPEDDMGMEWAENAEVRKYANSSTTVEKVNNSLILELNRQERRVTLETSDGTTHLYTLKRGNYNPGIYYLLVIVIIFGVLTMLTKKGDMERLKTKKLKKNQPPLITCL
ncbi:MAG: hypothetical protein A7316_02810 [Candidatus Altiarchaeales archaeon WOR_SM1_86-2]|nr:MAG: hypothetical protein A7316_02810 [Candidatus Altiarchaeales archaeon WOR_SM1_86-2]